MAIIDGVMSIVAFDKCVSLGELSLTHPSFVGMRSPLPQSCFLLVQSLAFFASREKRARPRKTSEGAYYVSLCCGCLLIQLQVYSGVWGGGSGDLSDSSHGGAGDWYRSRVACVDAMATLSNDMASEGTVPIFFSKGRPGHAPLQQYLHFFYA